MGEVILRGAALDRIVAVLERTLARGGHAPAAVRAAVIGRLGRHAPLWRAAAAGVAAAERAALDAEGAVLAVRSESFDALGTVVFGVRNALGRPRPNPLLRVVLPGGMKRVTKQSPARAAALIADAAERLRLWRHPALDAAAVAHWAALLAAAGVDLRRAARAWLDARAARTLARAQRAVAVRAAWAELPRIKRDLQNLGLSEVALHRVLPDSPRPRRRKPRPRA